MAKTELTIEAKLNVSDETAAACLVLLNMYLKENAPELIVEENIETGVTQIKIRKKQRNYRAIIGGCFYFGDLV